MKPTYAIRIDKTAAPGRALPQGAFSLIELLAVMAIVAVLSGATAMMFSDGKSLGIRSSSALVSSTLSMARDLAVTSNRRTRFAVVTENTANPGELRRKSYGVLQYDDKSGEFVVVSALKQLPAGVYFSEDPENEATGQGIFGSRDHTPLRGTSVEYAFIEFLPSGGTQGTSGENIFSLEAGTGADQTLSEKSDYARLGVAQHTGRVKVERK
jgi:prepilin-type N-terminal cleavage/methylation domain-containing protein